MKDDERERRTREIMAHLGLPRAEADFAVSFLSGETPGDVERPADPPKPDPGILARVLDYLKVRRPE